MFCSKSLGRRSQFLLVCAVLVSPGLFQLFLFFFGENHYTLERMGSLGGDCPSHQGPTVFFSGALVESEDSLPDLPGTFRILSLSAHCPSALGNLVEAGVGDAEGLEFLLVDGDGEIRGVYSSDPEDLERLEVECKLLLTLDVVDG